MAKLGREHILCFTRSGEGEEWKDTSANSPSSQSCNRCLCHKRFLERAFWLSLQYLLGQTPASSSAISSLKLHTAAVGSTALFSGTQLGLYLDPIKPENPVLTRYQDGNVEAVKTEGKFPVLMFLLCFLICHLQLFLALRACFGQCFVSKDVL